jgi:hypothetical protein
LCSPRPGSRPPNCSDRQSRNAALFQGLVAERDRLQDEIRDTVRPALEDVANSTAAVRRELVATGARTQEWVDEHLPQPPSPETFSGTFSGTSGPAHS